MELKLVVKGFSLFSHREEFKGGIFFNLLVCYIVSLHVNLSTFEMFDRLCVLAEFMEGFDSFFMGGMVSSVHQNEHLFVTTANLRLPAFANNFLNVLVILSFGDGSTLVERGQFII